MTNVPTIDDDDFLVSPRILEQRRTGIVAPLSARGLCGLVEEAPRELTVVGVEVTPENIVQRVRAEVERGVGWRHYAPPTDKDFEAVTDHAGWKSSAGRSRRFMETARFSVSGCPNPISRSSSTLMIWKCRSSGRTCVCRHGCG